MATMTKGESAKSPTGTVNKPDPAIEQALVKRAKDGDLKAYDELVQRYQERIYATVYHMTSNHEDANDLAQETFIKAYQALRSFKGGSSFYTWVYRIVTNVCLDHMRRRSARPEDQAPETLAGHHSDGPDALDFFERQQESRPDANPERRLLGREIGREISAALQQLSPRERMVFELKHYQGMKLRAIGEVLGTSEETVKNSLFRATQKLRARLGHLL